MRPLYPFSALVGQEPMKLALILNAVNPRLGGVLIRGQKGTAKSTAARAIAALLPPVEVVSGCRFGCEPRAGAARCPECATRGYPTESDVRPPAFVELPIGATEDRVLGSLDVEKALADGQRQFEPGLLARANRGLLYVDEVNLLPDHLVDTLLDAAAMGRNTVEREGISFSHAASFVLVGTMNPEEGELRPQLLDRFALAVDVASRPSASERAEVVRRRIAFEADPSAFTTTWQDAERAEQARVSAAQQVLPVVRVDDTLLELIAEICTAFEVEGLRADIVIYKTALTLAAYDGRDHVTTADIRRAAELALPHRRRRMPFDQPGLDHQRLDDIVRNHVKRSSSSSSDESRDGHCDDPDGPPPHDAPDDRTPGGGAALPRTDQPSSAEASPSGGDVGHAEASLVHSGQRGQSEPPPQVFAAAVVSPPAAPRPQLPTSGRASGDQAPKSSPARGATIPGPRGRHVRSDVHRTGSLDVLATLRAAAPHQAHRRTETSSRRIRLMPIDLRFKVRTRPIGTLTVFAVDASGSMAARRRMAVAKGVVLALLNNAYQSRDEVALIAFGGTTAEVLLPPTSSVDLASLRLSTLPTGGRTPLALALSRAGSLIAQRQSAQGHDARTATLVLVSDGRANVPLAEGDPYAEALAQARLLQSADISAVVVDTEDGPVRLERARRLALELGAHYIRLADLAVEAAPDATLAATIRHHPRRLRL